MPVRVLSTLALKGVLEKFRAPLERAAGPLELAFDATQAILPRVRAGETGDLLILTAEAIAELRAAGIVGEAWTLGCSGVSVAVRAGASGIYFSQVLERLGIADRLKKRVVVEKGPVGLAAWLRTAEARSAMAAGGLEPERK